MELYHASKEIVRYPEIRNSLFRKVFSESSSDINMYIIHIFIIFIHF